MSASKKSYEKEKKKKKKKAMSISSFLLLTQKHFKSTYHVLCTEKMEAFELENRNNYCINKNNKSIANSVGLKQLHYIPVSHEKTLEN